MHEAYKEALYLLNISFQSANGSQFLLLDLSALNSQIRRRIRLDKCTEIVLPLDLELAEVFCCESLEGLFY